MLSSPAFVNTVKEAVKSAVRADESDEIYEKCKSLIRQGKFLELTLQEKCDATWKSFAYKLSKGTLKWLLNASINNLPTLSNLKTWGKVTRDKCQLCLSSDNQSRESQDHILSLCSHSLADGRYTWRHNNVLSFIFSCLDTTKFSCYVDLPEQQNPGGTTMPAELTVTNLIPDLIVVDKVRKVANIFELTIPAENRIEAAHQRKAQT